MGTIIGRWSRQAVLAHLEAIGAVDVSPLPLADRARRRLEILQIAAAVEGGALTAAGAARALRSITGELEGSEDRAS